MTVSSCFSGIFRLQSVRSRYLAIATVFIVAIIAAAWVAHIKVNAGSLTTLSHARQREDFKAKLHATEEKLTEIEKILLLYLLAPEEDLRIRNIQLLLDASADIARMRQNPLVQQRPQIQAYREQLAKSVEKLNDEINRIMLLRINFEQLYPTSRLLMDEMLPAQVMLRTSAGLAITNLGQSLNQPQQSEIFRLFSDIRYAWANIIGSFRMYIANRFGIFGAPADGMLSQVVNINLYSENIGNAIKQLQDLDTKGKLNFELLDALDNIKQAYESWQVSFQQVKIIYESPAWRKDIPQFEMIIKPLLHDISSSLAAIDEELTSFSNEDMRELASLSDTLSQSIWLLVLVAIIGTILTYMMFEYAINRPLAKVAKVIKAEIQGKSNTELPQTRVLETRDLIESFDEMRQRVRNRQSRLEAILDNAGEAILTINEQGTIESFNVAAESLFGYQALEIIGENVVQLIPVAYRQSHNSHMQEFVETGVSRILGQEREVDAIHKSGEIIPVSLKISHMLLQGQHVFTGLIVDIRERRQILEQLQAREQRLKTILDNAAEGIITFDDFGVIHSFNNAAETLFGYSEKEVLDKDLSLLIPPQSHDAREGYLEHFMRTQIKQWIGHEGEVSGRHRDGSRFPLAFKVSSIVLEGKQLYTGLVSDISERKAMLEHLKKMAEHDGLTNLFNRSYFQQELERVVERVKRNKFHNHAVLYIDLDNFKYVNDTLGHAAGDQLLIEVSNILIKRSRRGELVARFGGDEFTVLLFDVTPEVAVNVAEDFRQSLVDYWFRYNGKEVDIGCSIGVASILPNNKTAEEILSQADIACNLAKRQGRNRVYQFKPEDQDNVDTMSLDMGWSRRIKLALENDRFVLACQPIVNTVTRVTESFEVLIRMLDDNNDIILPGGFMSSAERFGQAADIDKWVITNAIETLSKLRLQNPGLRYAINLSGQTLSDPLICELIHTKLEQTGLQPSALTFEVTETVAIADMRAATRFLLDLQELGCKTALDDFGSGMSSFAYLQDLPVNVVKIDGRFVKNMAENPVDQAMVKAMSDIAHALNKQTVAEFVQNEKSIELLAQYGVDYCQGFYLGRPNIVTPYVVAESCAVLKDQRAN